MFEENDKASNALQKFINKKKMHKRMKILKKKKNLNYLIGSS